MSESAATPNHPTSSSGHGYGPIKPIAVRLSESTRNQLDIIAQLNERSVTEEIRLAVEAHIEKVKADPEVQNRAQSVRDEIEREASGKREAIAAIFDVTVSKKPSVARTQTV